MDKSIAPNLGGHDDWFSVGKSEPYGKGRAVERKRRWFSLKSRSLSIKMTGAKED
jgi:hypothetical protein